MNSLTSILLHLRLPFSWFLLPIYLVALLSAGQFNHFKAWMVFLVLHFFLYTASNSFNSVFDRDTGSIGVLRHPPAIHPALLWVSLILDAFAIIIAFSVDWIFAAGVFIYGLASKAYSIPSVRVKKHPVTGWLFTGLGQGSLTFLLVILSVNHQPINTLLSIRIWCPALLIGLFLLGFYPLTQVYQHREDAGRGDKTLSLILGIRGTFFLSAGILSLAIPGFFWYFLHFWNLQAAYIFLLLMVPAAGYFIHWTGLVFRNGSRADYDHAMRMCMFASTGMNLFCGWLLWMH